MDFMLKEFPDLSINLESNIELIVLESDISDLLSKINSKTNKMDMYALESILSNVDDIAMEEEIKDMKEANRSFIQKVKDMIAKIKEMASRAFKAVINSLKKFATDFNIAITNGLILGDITVPTKTAEKFDYLKKLEPAIDTYYQELMYSLEKVFTKNFNGEDYDNDPSVLNAETSLRDILRKFKGEESKSDGETTISKDLIKSYVKNCGEFIKKSSIKITKYQTNAYKLFDRMEFDNDDNSSERRNAISHSISSFKYVTNNVIVAAQMLIVEIRRIAIKAIPKKISDKVSQKKMEKEYVKNAQKNSEGFRLPKNATALA